MAKERGKRKRREGIVVSDKMDKTIVVQGVELVRHPFYGRVVRKRSRFKVHDEKNEAKVGDKVVIEETRPLSRDKRWRLAGIIK